MLKITGLDIRYQEPSIAKISKYLILFYNTQLFLVFIINSFTKKGLKSFNLLKFQCREAVNLVAGSGKETNLFQCEVVNSYIKGDMVLWGEK